MSKQARVTPKFSYKASAEAEAVDVFIYGVIGYDESYWDEGTNNTSFHFVNLVKKLEKQYNRINVHINSPGGYISEGLAMFNALKASTAEIHTYNDALTASMGSIIFLAGTTHMPKTAIFHLHSASTWVSGNKFDLQQAIEELETFEKTLIAAISSRVDMTDEEIEAKWFDGKEYYYNGAEAQALGFIDHIDESTVQPPANKATLENMAFEKVVALYQQEPEENKRSFIDKIVSIVNNRNTDKTPSNMKYSAKLSTVLAVLALSEFELNANNNAELSIEDLHKIEDNTNNLENKLKAAEEAKAQLEKDLKAANEAKAALQAKLDGKPGTPPANPKNSDGETPDDDGEVLDLDDETSKKIQNWNKENGII